MASRLGSGRGPIRLPCNDRGAAAHRDSAGRTHGVSSSTNHHRGYAAQVRDLPSYFAKSGIQCFGAEVLLVDDGTGALEVLVPGVRGNPVAAQPMCEGERVRLGVVIRAQDASEKSHLLEGQRFIGSERAHGIANFVERLGQ